LGGGLLRIITAEVSDHQFQMLQRAAPDRGDPGQPGEVHRLGREDRELLAELARLNGDMASLALRIMEGTASAVEQRHYAQRLIAAGERLQLRAEKTGGMIIEGEVEAGQLIALPEHTVEPDWEP
ncbi:MAG: hypothetical protein ACRDTA_21240, partial [Pseudonocardiaceae bacterium]